MNADNAVAVGDDEVDRHIVALSLDFVFIEELEIVAHANGEGFGT